MKTTAVYVDYAWFAEGSKSVFSPSEVCTSKVSSGFTYFDAKYGKEWRTDVSAGCETIPQTLGIRVCYNVNSSHVMSCHAFWCDVMWCDWVWKCFTASAGATEWRWEASYGRSSLPAPCRVWWSSQWGRSQQSLSPPGHTPLHRTLLWARPKEARQEDCPLRCCVWDVTAIE